MKFNPEFLINAARHLSTYEMHMNNL